MIRPLNRRIDALLRPFQNGPLALLLAVGWIVAVLTINSLPADRLPDLRTVWYKPAHADKLAHFVFYGVMAALVFNVLAPSRRRPGWHLALRRALLLALVIPMAMGVYDEWNQLRVPGRSADLWDVAADWAGAWCAVALAALKWQRYRD